TPPLPWPRLMLISCANAGSASDPAAIRMAKNKTLRGTDADLTKGSLDGPAGMPSRLQDSQSRSWASAPGEPSTARCGAAADGPPAIRARPVAHRPVVRPQPRRLAGAAPPPAAAP